MKPSSHRWLLWVPATTRTPFCTPTRIPAGGGLRARGFTRGIARSWVSLRSHTLTHRTGSAIASTGSDGWCWCSAVCVAVRICRIWPSRKGICQVGPNHHPNKRGDQQHYQYRKWFFHVHLLSQFLRPGRVIVKSRLLTNTTEFGCRLRSKDSGHFDRCISAPPHIMSMARTLRRSLVCRIFVYFRLPFNDPSVSFMS